MMVIGEIHWLVIETMCPERDDASWMMIGRRQKACVCLMQFLDPAHPCVCVFLVFISVTPHLFNS